MLNVQGEQSRAQEVTQHVAVFFALHLAHLLFFLLAVSCKPGCAEVYQKYLLSFNFKLN